MQNTDSTSQYNESLILSELERRFYLYLIGGEYEKLFYSFDGEDQDDTSSEHMMMSRIRLEVEVTSRERQKQIQGGVADPDYKAMLDYMLKGRIANKLENQENLLATCSELSDLQPILESFGSKSAIDDELISIVENIPWLNAQVLRFAANPQYQKLVNLPNSTELNSILQCIGYPLFLWLLPRFCSEVLQNNMHPSMMPVVQRMRQFGRFTSGAIATLISEVDVPKTEKWTVYMLAAINIIPLFLIMNLINSELLKLLEQQRESLLNDPVSNARKLAVLEGYQFSGDALREFLSLEEILKPHILETIGFKYFDPMPYLLGYADPDSPIASIFFKARAYAFYRQLFKTGRIHPHETAVFLKKHDIKKQHLHQLNQYELTSIASHIKLHQKIIAQS